jgi:uncharacterized membrane protein YccC
VADHRSHSLPRKVVPERRILPTGGDAVSPAPWYIETLRVRRASIPVGHSLRAGVAVGGPFILGAMTDQMMTGMWIALAGLLLAAGEREGTYRLNFLIIAVSTPIAAAGFLVGYAQDATLWVLVPALVAAAFVAGIVAGLGIALSIATMQFLLISSIALGTHLDDWWTPLALYFVGAAIYAALLAVQMLIDPRRPQRLVLHDLLSALATLARARAAEPNGRGSRTAAARSAVLAGLRECASREAAHGTAWHRGGGSWVLTAAVVDAAERTMAALIGEDDAHAADTAAQRLSALAAAVGKRAPAPAPAARESSASLASRVDALERALFSTAAPTSAARPARPVVRAVSREVVLAACRLALCFGIAVAAKAYFPSPHWFWVPLTVCLVMKPDFGSVFSRALQRVVGTLAGAVLAAGILAVVPRGVAIGVVITLLAACVPWFMRLSYALQAAAITPIVVLMIDEIQSGTGLVDTGGQRLAATAIGAAIVIVFGYLIWPRSRRRQLARTWEAAMRATAEYLRIAACPTPDSSSLGDPRDDRMAATRRQAYTSILELDDRVHRMLAEPPPAVTEARAWLGIGEAGAHLADAVTAYGVGRCARGDESADRAAKPLAAVIVALGTGAADAVTVRPVGDLGAVAEAAAGAQDAVTRHPVSPGGR